MATNRRLVSAKGPDFYCTPHWGTQALLKYEKFKGNILEPCAGEGDMAKVLASAGYKVIASDLYDRGYGKQKDVFDITKQYDNIVTNPPFNIAEKILDHCLPLARNKVCLLLRTAFLESASRYRKYFGNNIRPSKILVFSERLSMYPKGHPVKGGGTTSYSWFIFDKQHLSGPTIVEWIAPGLKPNSRSQKTKKRFMFRRIL